MAVDELSRNRLFNSLRDEIGEEEASTLMTYLPPVQGHEIATKQDLRDMEQRLITQIRAELHAEIYSAINTAITSQTRTLLFGLIGAFVAQAALFISYAELIKA